MRSLESFAALLAASGTLPTLSALAAELGFTASRLPIDATVRATLALPPSILHADLIPGHGALRCLLLDCATDTPLRTIIAGSAHHLGNHAPQLLWLLLATQHGGPELAIATWAPDRTHPHIAALHIDRTHVVPSDAETVAALAAASSESDLLAHAEWLDALGRDALTRRFYRTLERVVANLAASASGHATPSERAELALLYTSRLLFLGFLQAKRWLDGNRRFLGASFARCMERGGNYHRAVLLPLFFGTLNTPPNARAATARSFGRIPFLNGGLFTRTALERRRADLRFSDEALGAILGELLARYRFSPREESTGWSEAAVDPEMLGKAFESLMESHARRATGAFFTPRRLVATVSHAALSAALASPDIGHDQLDAALRGDTTGLSPADAQRLRTRCASLSILDPACGSGAFLVHILEQLSTLLAQLGDPRPIWQLRRDLLTTSIFGVDVNPTAVWLCELRLWLSVVIDCDVPDPLLVPPLPNIDRHIRVGDSLAGDPFGTERARGARSLARLRERYARSTGPRKHTLRRALERAERTLAITHIEHQQVACAARRRDLLTAIRGRDLFGQRVRPDAATRRTLALERDRGRALATNLRRVRDGGALPFAWITHFPDIARHGGFDVILGNPPWVRLHRIPPQTRADLRYRFAAYRNAAWRRGARVCRAGPGFAAQVDLAALFAERALALLRPAGTLSLLLPAKLWRALAGGGLRTLLDRESHVLRLDDWSDAPAAFDAAVYPSLIVARRQDPAGQTGPRQHPHPTVQATRHRRHDSTHWTLDPRRLPLDDDPASPWLLAPPDVRDAFDRLATVGIALGESPLGAPSLGVKCGLNDAFVVRCQTNHAPIATVASARRSGRIERPLLRPLIRGETLTPWRAEPTDEHIIWTHAPNGAPLRTLPPHTHAWLLPWRHALSMRADAHSHLPWWSLFRTRSARPDRPRVVWADLGRAPRALVLLPGNDAVPLNTCYVLSCPAITDALTLTALLNSPLVTAWLDLIAEPARGGYRRFLAWTISLLPIPRSWPHACSLLAPLAANAANGSAPAADELLDAAIRAYGLQPNDVAPLLEWSRR